MSSPRPEATITAHAPERRRRRGVVASCGCCCCCCCLHAVGGLIGSALASRTGSRPATRSSLNAPKTEELVHKEQSAARSAVPIYWFSLLAVILTTVALAGTSGSDTGFAVLVFFFILPALQLIATVLALAVVAVLPLPAKGAAAGQVGRIALAGFLWALGGIGVMVALGGVFSILS
jgi:hypothetical protein